jgi:hypothetical protein
VPGNWNVLRSWAWKEGKKIRHTCNIHFVIVEPINRAMLLGNSVQGGFIMKKGLVCIGAFLVLFLMFGVYSAQAMSYSALTQLNGKWLKMSGSAKGVTYTEFQAEAAAVDTFTFNFKDHFACIAHNPVNDYGYLNVYDKAGKQIGVGYLYFHGGTAEQWTGRFEVYLAVGIYDDYATDGTNLTAFSIVNVKIKDDASNGSIKGVGGYGYADYLWTANDYSDMIVKINAKIIAAGKLPFTGPDCFK